MKKLKILLMLPLLLLTGCKEERIYVTSLITNKYDYVYNQVVHTGKTTVLVSHHRYVFQFNEIKPYSKSVSVADYNDYEVGDSYTFWISGKETQYFFEDSYDTIKVEKNK